jgi:hypothetical protein
MSNNHQKQHEQKAHSGRHAEHSKGDRDQKSRMERDRDEEKNKSTHTQHKSH